MIRINTDKSAAELMHKGDICSMKLSASVPDCSYRYRFCGLPNGIRREPLMAAIFSIDITGSMHSSLPAPRNSIMVSGTKMISETSLVTNMDVKNTPNIRKKLSDTMLLKRELKRIRGKKRSSCLKPSNTVSIIKRVPRVCQSILDKSVLSGGVINNEMTAAASATGSMGSFFMNFIIYRSFSTWKM
jgi:hypothetical protein